MIKAPVAKVVEILKKIYPDAGIALKFSDVWQLLVVVILSAQCTDERVNKVSPPLFKRFTTVENFAECDLKELEKMIYSTGFYKAKARNIRAAAVKIVNEYGGKVPDSMEELLKLPGVARKTANVVLSTAFGKNVGVVVDTHVARLTGLLGWVPKKISEAKNAVKIEEELMKIVPHDEWGKIAHLLIRHGRRVCIARSPKCEICPLNKICPSSRV